MSMLAGPRRKQKFTLNPRGKHWSEDSNKFGQKLMEKMGWSAGKGLGAKEQGTVDHVRVKVKNDQVGIGFKKDQDDQWTGHQADFNDFLQNLQKELGEEPVEKIVDKEDVLSGKSLEEQSKLSQKRVHYKKFTRGKDVNKYSTKDLANIFGKKEITQIAVKADKEEEEKDEELYDPIGAKDNTAGILTIKGGNMTDYFKNKLPSSGANFSREEEKNSDDDSSKYTGFGFSTKSTSKFYVNENAEEGEEESPSYAGFGFAKNNETKPKGKKGSNLDYVFDNPCLDLNILDDSPAAKKISELKNESNISVTPKKRKNPFMYDDQGMDIDFEETQTPKKPKNEHAYENGGLDLEYQNGDIPQKQKSDYIYENQALDLETPKIEEVQSDNQESLRSSEKSKSKKKKKIKSEPQCNGYENPGLDLNYSEISTPTKPRIIKCEIISPGRNNSTGMDLSVLSRTKKEPTMENENDEFSGAYENPGLDLSALDGIEKENNSGGVSCAYENPGLDLEFQENHIKTEKIKEESMDTSNELSGKKKRKKSKNKKEIEIISNVFENPGLDLNNSADEACGTTNFEVQRVCGLENNALNLSDEEAESKRVTFNEEIEYNTDISKKKKKKKHKLDKYEVESSKLKKKHKIPEPIAFVNEGLDTRDKEELENEANEKKSRKTKRRRERRISLLETIAEAPEEENVNENEEVAVSTNNHVEVEEEICYKGVIKKRNKKKKNKRTTDEDAEICELEKVHVSDIEVMEVDASERPEPITKKKKKKKNKKTDAENANENSEPSNNMDVDGEEIIDVYENVEKKTNRKKEKKTSFTSNNQVTNELEKGRVCNEIEIVDIKKKKKKKDDDDVISLEDFLSEENDQVKELNKQSVESDVCVADVIQIPEESRECSNRPFSKTKQIMKTLFKKNPTLLFNGSNINEIKGYEY